MQLQWNVLRFWNLHSLSDASHPREKENTVFFLYPPFMIAGTAILSAPLQTVLDHLDTLEELVILLDPDVQGVKSTKHLASLCSFPSTWITYTYSMKESKSPLKAVLEGISSRQPDWTVRHLANMLRLMERNDAITVLAKLQLSKLEV